MKKLLVIDAVSNDFVHLGIVEVPDEVAAKVQDFDFANFAGTRFPESLRKIREQTGVVIQEGYVFPGDRGQAEAK